MSSTLQPIAVSSAEAAKMIGVSHRSMQHYVKAGRIAATQTGKRTLIEIAELKAFLLRNRVKGDDNA